jgi:predicted Zn-dependent protease
MGKPGGRAVHMKVKRTQSWRMAAWSTESLRAQSPQAKLLQTKSPRTKSQGLARCGRGALAAVLATTALLPTPASAQGIPLIRDTEIENVLKDYARPIFRAAGLGANNIAIRIVRHDSFNAFVADGRNVFINSGTITIAKSPNEVIGVLAHETGHITGGHLAALRGRIARDQTKILLVTVLGIGAMIAGATSSNASTRELGGAGQGVLLGGNEIVMRSLLSERRSQEAAADQAGLQFLNTTKQSGRGMLETFERFAQQEYVSDQYRDPFVRSHPVATERLAQLRERVEKSPNYALKDDPALQFRHDMIRAKIYGYLERTQTVLNKYPASDTTLPARYARAIARNCSGGCTQSVAEVDALIKEQPNNPYFHELKGSMQFRQGLYRDSIPNLRKALQLSGGEESLMQANLAQALVAADDPALIDEALALLRRSVVRDGDNSRAYTTLSTALYKKGQYPQAEYAAAQSNFIEGNFKQAQIFAKRAQTKLPQGSPEWNKAEEIVSFKIPTE